jgi:hypothetical protein
VEPDPLHKKQNRENRENLAELFPQLVQLIDVERISSVLFSIRPLCLCLSPSISLSLRKVKKTKGSDWSRINKPLMLIGPGDKRHCCTVCSVQYGVECIGQITRFTCTVHVQYWIFLLFS